MSDDAEYEMLEMPEPGEQPPAIARSRSDDELDWVLVRLSDLAVTVANERRDQPGPEGTPQSQPARDDQVRRS